ncbi:hypothetical protein N9W79_00610 [bacterium]|nr:hypothetical protein [bacterium]
MTQILRIYLTWVKSLFHKIFADLGKELVIAICGAVLIGLFFYMFTDFINSQLKTIPQATQDKVISIFTYILCFIAASLSVKIIKNDNPSAHFSISGWLNAMGETPASITGFRVLRAVSISAFFNWAIYYSVNRYIQSPPENFQLYSGLSFLFSTLLGLLLKPTTKEDFAQSSKISTNKLWWRISIILKRNYYSKTLFRFSAVLSLLFLVRQVSGSPLFSWGIFFLIGIFTSFSLYLHLSEELASSWLEKNSGMSHGEFISLTTQTSTIVGLMSTALALAFYVAGAFIYGFQVNPVVVIQMFFTCLGPALVVPNVLLQIDGRRASINMMSGFLISLFLCTAIFAHIASVALVAVLFYYGQSTQVDRYYRA